MKNLNLYLTSKKFCIDAVIENFPYRDNVGNLENDILVTISDVLGVLISHLNGMDDDINVDTSISNLFTDMRVKDVSNEVVLSHIVNAAVLIHMDRIGNTVSISSDVIDTVVALVGGIGDVIDVSFSDIVTRNMVCAVVNDNIDLNMDLDNLLSRSFLNGASNDIGINSNVSGFIKTHMTDMADDISLSMAVSAFLIVYRLLSDMDNSTLGDFDDMSLGDLYYTKEV